MTPTPWRFHADVHEPFWDHNLPFTERRDRIIAIIDASDWFYAYEPEGVLYQADPGTPVLSDLLEDLACTQGEAEFGEVWDEICDLADYDRCWLNAAFPPRKTADQ